MALLCEECDESHAVKYCASCEQKLCNDCDIRIHNKGKRAQHVRGNLMAQKKEYLVTSQSRAALPQVEVYNQGDLRISVFQQLNFSEEMGPKELASLQLIAADYYIEEAYKGNLMHEYEDFKKALFERFLKRCQPISKADFEDLFLQVKTNNFFHITVRKFGDMKPLRYCSLLLESISVEALVWILLSIKNDRMKPTDKLVLSRIKEYFLLKLSQKDWNSAMDHFYSHPASLCPTEHLPKLLLVDDRETASKVQLTAKSDNEQNKEDRLNSSYHFEVQNDRWDFEDIFEVEDNEDEDWLNFKKYIDEFFGEEAGSNQHDSRSRLRKQKNTRNIQKWLSSVENDLTKPTSSLTANHSLQKILTEQSISRAIPGGSPILTQASTAAR